MNNNAIEFGAGHFETVGFYEAVLETHAAPDQGDIGCGQGNVGNDLVFFLDLEFRMSETLDEFAIIGKDGANRKYIYQGGRRARLLAMPEPIR